MRKKFITIGLILALVVGCSGCGNKTASISEKPEVVPTDDIWASCDWLLYFS